MYTTQTTGRVPKMSFYVFFRAFDYEISEAFISRGLYIILNGLTFENDRKTHLFVSS